MDAAADAAAAAEAAARRSYGRLLAYLAYQWRNLAAAEDALADAFAAALTHWPRDGVPASPDGWLLTAARRQLLQAYRHAQVEADPRVTILLASDDEAAPETVAVPDERLRLLFVCAHPAIDASVRCALMLQTVLGLDARRIAAAHLVSPAAMAQRLVRAKSKIAAAGIRFETPEARDLPARVHAVLEAIYAAYALGSDASPDGLEGADSAGLAAEALYLAELCTALLPASAEAAGLFALMLASEARRDARTGPQGEFVPLLEQDTSRWNRPMIRIADEFLGRAARLRDPGPFQIEAAIQAAHCQRAFGAPVPWPAIARLYENLLALAPTIGAQVGHAVALGEAHGAAAGLGALAPLDGAEGIADYQPYWAARAHLLALAGEKPAAETSYTRAMGLTADPAVRAYLQRRRDALRPAAGR